MKKLSKSGKIGLIAAVLLLVLVFPAFSDFKTDIGLHIPYYIGIDNLGDDDNDDGTMIEYAFVVPDIRVQYYFGPEWLHVGPGIRGFTAILETLAFPIVSVESELNRFVLNANAGGGAFLLFGLYQDLLTGSVFISEGSAAFKLTDWFSIGTGAIFLTNPGGDNDVDAFACVGTAFLRFTF